MAEGWQEMRVSRSHFDGSPCYCRLRTGQPVFSPILLRVMDGQGMLSDQQKYFLVVLLVLVAAAARVVAGSWSCHCCAWNCPDLVAGMSYYFLLLTRVLFPMIPS